MDIGKVIKEERMKKGLSLRELAEKCDISFSYLASIERGERKPESVKAYTILKTLFPFGDKAEEILREHLSKEMEDVKKLSSIISNVNLSEKQPMKQIPTYGSVSAGHGEISYGEITGYTYTTANDYIEGMFSIHVKGDSMEPKIPEGALVKVIPQYELNNKDIGIFIINGDEGVVKQFFRESDFIRLVSFNQNYRDIIIMPNREDFSIVGKVKSVEIEL